MALNTLITQKSKTSFWFQLPKYVASIAVIKLINGLSSGSLALKSDLSLISNVSLVGVVAIPLNVLSLVLMISGFLSKTYLQNQ